MSLVIRRTPEFVTDFENLFSWHLSQGDEKAAWQFLASLEVSLTKLSHQPDLGRPRHFRNPELRALRSYGVTPPFESILIFYRATASSLDAFRLITRSTKPS